MTTKARFLPSILAVIILSGLGALSAWADDYDLYSRLTDNPSFTYHPSPEDWRDVNMYQLFTDRFFDGNSGNNFNRYSTIGTPWYNQTGSGVDTNRHFFQGGDWAGIKQKLGYLKDMGVNCIWISGVQLNEQGIDKRFTPYHAYHPANFYRCEPMFGTFAELKDLIDAAHSNGIYVCLDVVPNHMADLLKYTDCNCNYEGYCDSNCGSLDWWDGSVTFGAPFNGPQYFHNNGTIGDNDWDTYPKYIKGAFLGTEDLNTEDAYVQGQLKQIFKDLIDATDCDGFRVDAIKHIEFDFIRAWADDIRDHAAYRGKNMFLLFGEYFSYSDATQASYCKDNDYSFNSTLWFPMQLTMKNVFAYEQGTSQLADRMNAMGQYNNAGNRLVAFIDNHDVDRIALECGSSWETKMQPALTFLYTCTPVPCLFYGTEQGFNQGDHRNGAPKLGLADWQRETMWNFGFQPGNAYGDKFVQSTLYNYIKQLNQLRAQYISLRRGSVTQRWSEGGKGLFAISRAYGDEEALVAFNTDWGSKSCNPQVSKPNGTQFINVLNPSETVTVADGRLSFSVDAKGSKIFVAGQGNAVVNTSCSSANFTVTYTPNNGPLAGYVGGIHIGIGHDGQEDITNALMTQSGSDWTYQYSLASATNEVNFWFYDEDSPPTYDNNNGMDWNIDITTCGDTEVDLSFVGNTYHWPYTGEWDPGESLWINSESWPQSAVISAEVVYSPDGGTTWTAMPMTINGQIGNNDAWHANVGTLPGGATIEYAIHMVGRNGDVWDNNGTANYSNKVNAGTTTVQWVGNTYHWPENGSIEPGGDLWIDIDSWPVGAAVTGDVVYSTDGGASWQGKSLSHNGTHNNNDWWHVNLGGFPGGTTVRYAVKIVDGDDTEHWDNNGGTNFIAEVNPAASSIRWFGNTIQAGTPQPWVDIDLSPTSDAVRVGMDELKADGMYTVMVSHDLVTWSNAGNVNASAETGTVEVAGATGSVEAAFYRLRVDWVPASVVYSGQEAVVSIETWPIAGATGANLVFSSDGGSTWDVIPMAWTGTRGNNDIWTASLGVYPLGTVIQYAIEVIDDQDASQWDNNNSQDYTLQVRDPSVSDYEPPTTSYSPQNTTTTNLTLNVTLSATDDIDPTPTIHFTTNGSAPSVASPTYSAPIVVTDHGAGVDLTIKFFARDDTGNTSDVTTIEVKVNEGFDFGPDKPYSLNPTL
ncbi:MAG: chitobiase/beta-hexosaminidase C-terminal domain-containing protein, partial [Kiritimatiellae bacterium]|nr:chitobiase/beta-hexosaminidase C-terminal domain-containing protein [Kiritimatiellia bacterium]